MSRRKMLAAKEEIANDIVDLANEKDLTVYQTVNDILTQALRVEGMGLTLKEVVDERWMLERAREIGLTFIIEHLLYQIVDEAYTQDPEAAKKLWVDIGHWYGKYFQSKSENPIESFAETMELLTFGISEFILEKEEDDIAISCIGERYTEGYTELFSLFIENALEIMGYDLVEKDTSKGIIRLKLKNR
ncbi:MAG: hypothetical protein ACLFVP_09945 [Candidatus Bathyarchaeia archaeon]